jgi:hypothetical protein
MLQVERWNTQKIIEQVLVYKTTNTNTQNPGTWGLMVG